MVWQRVCVGTGVGGWQPDILREATLFRGSWVLRKNWNFLLKARGAIEGCGVRGGGSGEEERRRCSERLKT